MFGILEAVAVPQNGIYSTYEELERDLSDRVSKDGYKIVKARSHKDRTLDINDPANAMVRCDLVCDRGGRPYRSQAKKHKTSTKKTDCPWKAKAVYRKTINGWILTIVCDQHNHEPGTPEPPSPPASGAADGEDGEDAEADEEGPRPDPDTSTAMQLAGVSNSTLRLTGDTFHQFKSDYRRMSQPERLGILSQLQLRIAAIYAVQNEEVQRNRRHEAAQKRHAEIEATRRQRLQDKRQRRQQTQPGQQMGTPIQQVHMPPQQQQQHPHMPPQNHGQPQQHIPQQFHLPDSPSQQLMSLQGVNMNMPQQQLQYPGPPRRIRGHRPSQNGQQIPQDSQQE